MTQISTLPGPDKTWSSQFKLLLTYIYVKESSCTPPSGKQLAINCQKSGKCHIFSMHAFSARACTTVCMHVFMYVCHMSVTVTRVTVTVPRTVSGLHHGIRASVRMYVCMSVCMHVCMYVVHMCCRTASFLHVCVYVYVWFFLSVSVLLVWACQAGNEAIFLFADVCISYEIFSNALLRSGNFIELLQLSATDGQTYQRLERLGQSDAFL